MVSTDRPPPIISVEFNPYTGEYTLMATSHDRTMPAGDRLLRIPFGAKWPVIRWVSPRLAEAEANAELLRHALANPPKKTRKGSEEASHEMQQKVKEAVWNL